VCAQRGGVFPLEDVLREGLGDNHFLYPLLMALTAECAVSVRVEAGGLGGVQVVLDLLAEVICLLGRGQLGQRDGQCLGILRASASKTAPDLFVTPTMGISSGMGFSSFPSVGIRDIASATA